MKTIATNRSGLYRGLFLLAALGGLYYFRRKGGKLGTLLTAGASGIETARTLINDFAPSTVAKSETSSASRAAQI